jgi:hypothetical protein
MFAFFSNRLGCVGSLLIYAIPTPVVPWLMGIF